MYAWLFFSWTSDYEINHSIHSHMGAHIHTHHTLSLKKEKCNTVLHTQGEGGGGAGEGEEVISNQTHSG